jgi:hypothetical protein
MKVSKETIERKMRLSDRSVRSLFLVLLETYAEKVKKRRIGEKTPPNIHYVLAILKMFPNARIINIVRDPRDVVNSLLAVPWASTSVFGNVRRWQQCVRLHLKYSQSLPEHTYTSVRYEDLISHPEEELKRLCDFLDISFTTEMLNFYKRKEPGFSSREIWKSGTFDPINTASIGKGIRKLGRARIALIEWVAHREMRQLGYECIFNRNFQGVLSLPGSAIAHAYYLIRAAINILRKDGLRTLLRSRPGK